MERVTHNREETLALGAEIAATFTGGMTVALIGDLGAGKTTLTQGIVAYFDKNIRVKSPTFTVMNEYVFAEPVNGIARIIHIDFYRFTEERELGALSLEDEMRPDTVIIAEWPNIFDRDVFRAEKTITLAHRGGDERVVTVS